jgi:hypothetical protein
VQPLEPPRQQRQLVLSKHIKLLIWNSVNTKNWYREETDM